MHEDAPILKAKTRERTGTRYSKRVRDAGGMPAIVYGHGEKPAPVVMEAHELNRMIHDGEKIFRMELDGSGPETVLLKDVQFDYLGTDIVHCDFARVDLNERMTVSVPLRFRGQAPGMKQAGAVMMHPHDEIELECTLSNLPDEIEVDMSGLDVHDTITAADVKLPLETMKLMSDPDMVVAQIIIQAQEEEDTTSEGGEVSDAAEPEVISEKKDKDEDDKD